MVFKFYYQIWVIWGICAAVSLAKLAAIPAKQKFSGIYRSVAMLTITCGVMYTFAAIPARQSYQMDPNRKNTLDGSRFMRAAIHQENGKRFSLIWDYQAIHWIQNNLSGTPVIVEGQSAHEYLWGSRIAVHTGLPTVMGWRYHVSQSRSILPAEFVQNRVRDVNRFFNDTNIASALEFIEKYRVDLIYVGPLEQVYYSEEGLEKFNIMSAMGLLHMDYENPRVKIYSVSRP
jgi:uncharacterized membrane protein